MLIEKLSDQSCWKPTQNSYLIGINCLLLQNKPPKNRVSLDGQTRLQSTLNLLDGVAAPAASWEADLYPARIPDYDPNWLDVMCISGKIAWGRYTLPASSQRNTGKKKSSGPVKSTPITLASRQNLDIWQDLARSQLK